MFTTKGSLPFALVPYLLPIIDCHNKLISMGREIISQTPQMIFIQLISHVISHITGWTKIHLPRLKTKNLAKPPTILQGPVHIICVFVLVCILLAWLINMSITYTEIFGTTTSLSENERKTETWQWQCNFHQRPLSLSLPSSTSSARSSLLQHHHFLFAMPSPYWTANTIKNPSTFCNITQAHTPSSPYTSMPSYSSPKCAASLFLSNPWCPTFCLLSELWAPLIAFTSYTFMVPSYVTQMQVHESHMHVYLKVGPPQIWK